MKKLCNYKCYILIQHEILDVKSYEVSIDKVFLKKILLTDVLPEMMLKLYLVRR